MGEATEDFVSISLPVPDLGQLTSANLSHTIRTQVLTIIGDENRIREAAATFFRTIHSWFPVVAENLYYKRLSQVHAHVSPGASLLTLCMFLLGVIPIDGEIPLHMHSLYILVKGFVASLEAVGTNSLDMLQCRLLLTIFEVGHGMYPAAYISMGANVRAAVALGANVVSQSQLIEIFKTQERADEARCTWRGIVITDRYVSLESNRAPSIPKGLLSETVGGNNDCEIHELSATPFQPMYQFKKLAQASRLLEQVLSHVHDPVQQMEFFNAEAIQILKTLGSFRGTVHDDCTVPHSLWYGPEALCRSALMTILEFGYTLKNPPSTSCVTASFALLGDVIQELVDGCEILVAQRTLVDLEAVPVFAVHSVYKAAQVLLGVLRGSPRFDCRKAVGALKILLRCMSARWLAGKRYLEDLEKQIEV
ncbi:hypothetical protein ETB97_009560 [Aspergillus alliaceus]|uniref:Xylanolytic transcriptional activator regulatory domain-containing protein n=1 Tax=Petromyces alliaceus TaxID=209559 RepID=A0A8H6E1Z0_PETAA|nr:hypothetical protein ETB97_009560 [Aspergillus burnettii]